MPPTGGRETPIAMPAQGLFSFTTNPNEWFGPGKSLAPAAQAQTEGRAFDYPVAWNIQIRTKTEGVTFQQLRALADGYDLLRLAIETRKDQLDILNWTIRARDKKAKVQPPRAKEIEKFLQSPDQEHTWGQWLRILLEDLYVIDAPAIYMRRTKGGQPWGLEIVDGGTIKRILDDSGRTPLEGPAYQQILKGVPTANYTRQELLYVPRNLRSNKVYGYSQVEQVITTVNIALRRQLHQLSYYTDGSTPNLIFSVPKEWNPDQIRQFQAWWDSLLAGNPEGRARARFVPEGIKPIDTKEQALKDEYDEWLARIICYAFSLSPQAFVKQMNRATAETAQETAKLEGLRPLQNWIKGVMDRVLRDFFGAEDLEFGWVDEEALDPLEKAQVHQIYVAAGILTADEVREEMGLEALPEPDPEPAPVVIPPSTPPDQAEGQPASPGEKAPTGGQGGNPSQAPEPAAKAACCSHHEGGAALAKARRPGTSAKPINRRRGAILRAEKKLAGRLKKLFRAQADDLAVQIEKAIGERFGKAASSVSSEDLDWIVAQLNLEGWDALTPAAKTILGDMAENGGAAALAQIGVNPTEAANAAMVNQVNEDAVAWADNYAAELVKGIGETTRDRLRNDVAGAIDLGLSTDDLAEILADSYSFSDARAEMIARTEVARADVQGNLQAYSASGVVQGLEWIVSSEGGCPICEANLNAVVALGQAFPSGDEGPPAHPNCICDVLPVISESPTDEAA